MLFRLILPITFESPVHISVINNLFVNRTSPIIISDDTSLLNGVEDNIMLSDSKEMKLNKNSTKPVDKTFLENVKAKVTT